MPWATSGQTWRPLEHSSRELWLAVRRRSHALGALDRRKRSGVLDRRKRVRSGANADEPPDAKTEE